MRIAEAFSKMRLSEYCSAQDIDRAIGVTVDSFVSSQKVSCKKALARAFAKYDFFLYLLIMKLIDANFFI
jgi:DNA replication licensing factor MCM2